MLTLFYSFNHDVGWVLHTLLKIQCVWNFSTFTKFELKIMSATILFCNIYIYSFYYLVILMGKFDYYCFLYKVGKKFESNYTYIKLIINQWIHLIGYLYTTFCILDILKLVISKLVVLWLIKVKLRGYIVIL